MAQEIADSKLIDTWSSDGLKVKPDISKIIEGWQLGEQPPHEYMNWLQNTFGSKLNHILKNGVATWNNATQYLAGSSVQHNGNVWLCKTTNTNSAPTDANANWKRIITVESLTTILGGYVKQSANLSDLADTATARTNLGLGTAATRNVGESGGNVMQVGAFGLGSLQASAQGVFPPPVSGIYQSSRSPASTLLVLPRAGTRSAYLEVDNGGGSFFLRGEHYDPSTQESLSGVVTFFHTGNILPATGQSTEFPMSQKAVTDELNTKVSLSGNQTIAGVKTFSSSPIVPTPTAGDNSTKVATTAFVLANSVQNANFASSLVANGYQKLPGGLILQWGLDGNYNAEFATTARTINFPLAFPNACFLVNGQTQSNLASGPAHMSYIAVSTWDRTSFVRPYWIGRMAWIAIGY